jgi:hypothetical protein
VIAVGEHQRLRCGAAHHVEGIEHLGEGDEVEIGPAEPAGGHAGARQERSLEPCAGRKLGAEPVPDGRHHDEAGLGEEGAQSVWWCHGLDLPGWCRDQDDAQGRDIKSKPQSWKEMYFPEAHSLPGK